jgi:hypothetical protein
MNIYIYTDKDYEIAFRDEQARSITEARTSKYISKVTSENLSVIDPTGRASVVDIQPSHITVYLCLFVQICVNISMFMYAYMK